MLLLQLVVSRLQICRRAAELIIHGDNITFELCWNFVFGDGLIDRFPRLRFVAGKGDKILAEVGVLLEVIPRGDWNVSGNDRIDVLDGGDGLRQG